MGIETAIALASLGMGAYQTLKGAQSEAAANKATEDAANQAARIAENDKFLALNVPTLGLEKAQQNMQAWQQSQIQALKDVGAAGVLGGLTATGQQARAQNQDLAVEAQNAQYQRDLAQAQNAQQIEQGRMQREFGMNQARLAGAQQAAAEGRQNQAAGIQTALSGLSNAATLNAYEKVNSTKNTLNQDAATNQQAPTVNYSSLRATGTPVPYNDPAQMGSVAGLTNQFAAMLTPMPQPQQLFETAFTQGTPNNPYPINWMIQNKNLPR